VTPGALTVFTSVESRLAKVYRLDASGALEKATAAQLSRGRFDVREYDGVGELAGLIEGLTTHQAICASLPTDGIVSGTVVAESMLASNPGAVARNKSNFRLQGGPGFLFLDHDAAGEGLSRDDLWQLLVQCCPALAEAGFLWRPSGSSHVCHGDQDLTGLRGQHLFVLLADVSDAPRVVKTIAARMWLAGHGRIDLSSAGSFLKRCPIDEAPVDAARLIFAAGSVCEPPLEQRRGPAVILSDGGFLDSRRLVADLSTSEADCLDALIESAKSAQLPEAMAVRARHRSDTISRRLPAMLADGVEVGDAAARIGAAVDAAYGGVLLADFELTAVIDGKPVAVVVGDLLKDRERWHEIDFLVPGNEGHRGGSADARAYLMGSSLIIYSLDGPQVFTLRAQATVIRTAKGSRSELVESLCKVLADQDDVFATDAGPVQVVDGRVILLTPQRLQNLVGSRVALLVRGSGGKDVPTDLTKEAADLTLAELT
jgi:hypothetical protein